MLTDAGTGLDAVLSDGDGPRELTALGVVRWVLRRQRRRILVGAVSGIAWMGAIALLPVALGGAVDAVADGDRAEVARWCAVVAGVVLAEAAVGVVRHRTAILLYIRTRWLLERLVTRRALDPRGGAPGDAGTLLSHVQNDAQAVGGIADLMCRGSGAVVTFVAVGMGMLLTAPLLGVIVLVGLPAAMAVLVPLWKPYDRRATRHQETLAAATSVAADSLGGLRVLKGLGAEEMPRRWFAEANARVRGAGVDLARLGAAWEALSEMVPGIFLAVVLWVAGHLALDGSLRPGELVTFTGLAVFLAVPLSTLAEVGDVWAGGLAGARRIATVLGAPPAVQEPTDGDDAVVAGVALHAVSAGPLDGLELRVDPGELVGIACTDPQAASTVVDLLARRRDPDRGVVAVGGVDVRRMRLEQLRGEVLVESGHDVWLLDATLRDNLALGSGPATDDKALVDALVVSAAEELAARGDGLDAAVGERGLSLSGGQRQRVAVARAVAASAPVLVLDDPTSALDVVTEGRLVQRLAAARRGRTTILVSLSPTVLAACDRVVLVDGGRVTAEGRHDRLLAHRRYRQLFGG